MPPLAWSAYDEASTSYFEAYESLQFAATHRSFLRFLPTPGANCLDIGAGSGRDAAALAKRGYLVTAVEPSNGLRRLAMARHRHPNIIWVDDSLPKLSKVKAMQTRYEFILLSAVWMHIPPSDRNESFSSLRELLKPNGRIGMTLRIGEPPPNRLMFPLALDDVLQQANSNGLVASYVSRTTRDSLKRSNVSWIKLILQAKGDDKN